MSAQLKIIDNITTNVGEGFIPSRKRIKEPRNNFSAIETVLREGINPSPTPLNGPGFHVVSSEHYVALDWQYIVNAEFQDVYDHDGRIRAAIRGFIKYLIIAYEQGLRKKGNPER